MKSHVFAGNPLDSAGNLRRDENWLATRRDEPGTRFLAMAALKPLVADDRATALCWLSAAGLAEAGIDSGAAIFLGLAEGRAHFAVDASASCSADEPLTNGAVFVDARFAASRLAGGAPAIVGVARALVDWHRRHRFCAVCGAPSRAARGGHMRICGNNSCGAEHFPRTDSVVIMLVYTENCCLLARNARFPEGVYSALAGFMEPGESIEEAVRRECFEETAIRIGTVRYHSSQPWPFPSSLMIGCLAEAESTAITIDGEELTEARWVGRDEARAALADPAPTLRLPPPMAIARHLIEAWVHCP